MSDEKALRAFRDRLDAYGPELTRWPREAAEQGFGLLARSPEARAMQKEARRFADLLAEAAQAGAPNGFAFRVVGEIASRRADRLSWLASPGRFGLAGLSLSALALALGVALGAAAGPAQAGRAVDADLSAAAEVALLDGDL